jgi:hypothetical protein
MYETVLVDSKVVEAVAIGLASPATRYYRTSSRRWSGATDNFAL